MITTSTRRAAVVALIVMVGCGGPAPAPPAEPTPREPRSVRDMVALEVLRRAPEFTTAGVGDTGEVPWENHALRMLVAAGDRPALEALLHDATPAGQLFALVGLAHVDSAAHAAALPAFRARQDEVSTLYFCFGGLGTVAAITAELEDGPLAEHVLPNATWAEPDPHHLQDGRTPAQWVERLAWARALPESRDALRRCGRHALPALIEGLAHANVRVRRASAWRLHALGPRAVEAVGPLARALEHDPDPQVRVVAAHALRELGPWAIEAAPALLRVVSPDADPWLLQPEAQLAAIEALCAITRYVPAAIDEAALATATSRVVERGVDDPVEYVRRCAEWLLWDAAPSAAVVRAVERFVGRASGAERAHRLDEARGHGHVAAALEVARASLRDSDPSLQRVSVDVLLEAGERARVEAALGELREAAEDDPRAIVLAARLDPTGAPAELVAALLPGAPCEVVQVATGAAAHAETLGVDACLIEASKRADPGIRHAARAALRFVTPWPALINAHVDRLDDPDPITRITAAEAVLLLEERQQDDVHSGRAREVLAAALADTTDLAARRRALEGFRRPWRQDDVTPQDLADPELPPWTRLELARAALGAPPTDMAVLLAARSTLAELVSSATEASLRREAIAALAEDGAASSCRRFEEDPDPVVRIHGTMGSVIGGDATPERVARVVHALPSLPARAREWVVEWLVWLARDLRGDDVEPALIESLTGALLAVLDDPELADDAVEGLDHLETDALTRGLDQARSARAIALLADELGEIVGYGREPRPAVEALERALARERDPRLRYLLTVARETPREVD